MSTVNAKVAARHEAAGVAEEEDSGTAVLLGNAKSLKHVLLGPLLFSLGIVVKQVQQHLSQDVAGRESVDTDAVLAPFGSQASGELDYTSLGGIVCSVRRIGQIPEAPMLKIGDWGTYGANMPRLAMVPLMLAIMQMLPGCFNRTIWRAAAWAVMKAPETLMLIIRSTSSGG